jgi:hypothetical protein
VFSGPPDTFEDKGTSKSLEQVNQRHGFKSQKSSNVGGKNSNHYALKSSRVKIREQLKYLCNENCFIKEENIYDE